MRNYFFITMIFSNFVSQFIYAAEFSNNLYSDDNNLENFCTLVSHENSYDEYGGSGNVLENYLYGKGGHFKLQDLGANELQSYAEESRKGNTILHLACLVGNIDIVKKSISQLDINIQNDDGDTPLHCACRKNHLHIVRFLVLAKADKNIENKEKKKAYSIDICSDCLASSTPLHDAAARGHAACLRAVLEWSSKDVNACFNYTGKTPLHFAVRNLQAPCVEILLGFGANVCSREKDYFTPFHEACSITNRRYSNSHFKLENDNDPRKQIILLLIEATKFIPLENARNAESWEGRPEYCTLRWDGTVSYARRDNLNEIATLLESYGGVGSEELTTSGKLVTGAGLALAGYAFPPIAF